MLLLITINSRYIKVGYSEHPVMARPFLIPMMSDVISQVSNVISQVSNVMSQVYVEFQIQRTNVGGRGPR